MDARKRVLVIDDDGDFRASVGALLVAEGFEVEEAASGREGLERIRALHPDVVVLDVMMENAFEGYGVTQALHYQPAFDDVRDVPVLMVSSIQESPGERFLKAEGEAGMVQPDDYLTKPLDTTRFVQAVRRLAARGR
jgi:CheY-like chemotaxis protein